MQNENLGESHFQIIILTGLVLNARSIAHTYSLFTGQGIILW